MTMSETAINRFAISRPLALRTFRLRLFLLTLVSLKFPEVFKLTSRFCGVVVLGSLPRSLSGHSILMISAPNAPSQRVAHGPARTQLKSTTRMLARARGRGIVSFSHIGCFRRRQAGFRTISWSYKNAYGRADRIRCGQRPPSPASGRNLVPESAVSTTPREYSRAAVLLPLPRRGSGCQAGRAANARAERTARHLKDRARCVLSARRRPSLFRDRGRRWRAAARPKIPPASRCRRAIRR